MRKGIAADAPVTTTTTSSGWEQTWKWKLILFCGLFLPATLVMMPIFINGFPNGDDASGHYRWVSEFAYSLREGTFYPRWLAGLNYGFGSLTALYYPPLTFYIGAAFIFLGQPPLTALALSCWAGLLLSAVTMYGFSRCLLDRPASLLAAGLYILMPYHLFDLYQRTAVAEFWSFAWVPLLLHMIYLATEKRSGRAVAWVAISYALLLLTHLPVAYATTLILPVYILALTRKVKQLVLVGGGLALGGGIAAIYLLPVIVERTYIKVSVHDLSLPAPTYDKAFLFEYIGLAFKETVFPANNNYSRFVLASSLLGLGVLLLLASSFAIVMAKRRSFARRFWQNKLFLAALLSTAVTLLLTTRLTDWLWRIVPQMITLGFPVRWLAVTSAGLTLLTMMAMTICLHDSSLHGFYIGAFSIALLFNLVTSAFIAVETPFQPGELESRIASFKADVAEYDPLWWDRHPPDKFKQELYMVKNGNAQVAVVDGAGARQSYMVQADSEAELIFRTLYFPGWVAYVDEQRVDVVPSKEGQLQLSVAPGTHTLRLSFEDTVPRRAGKFISAISLLVFFPLWLYITKRETPALANWANKKISELAAKTNWQRTDRLQKATTRKGSRTTSSRKK